MTYSLDFRSKVLEVKEREGLSFSVVASRFGVSKAAVFRWSKSIESPNKRIRKSNKIDLSILKKDIEDYPDSYSWERATRFGVSASGIRYAKKLLGVSYKKKPQSSEDESRRKVYILPSNSSILKRR